MQKVLMNNTEGFFVTAGSIFENTQDYESHLFSVHIMCMQKKEYGHV